MKTFDELLMENNIKKPRTSFGKSRFDKRWAEARYLYARLCDKYEDKSDKWEKHFKSMLQVNWGETFPTFPDLVPLTIPEFSNCQQALRSIYHANEQIENIFLGNLQLEQANIARAKWVKSLIEKAGDDCSLIVIKGNYKPYDFNIKKFNEAVNQHRPNAIYEVICPIWVAFDPHQECSTDFWLMDKMTSTVEFIRK